MHVNEIFPSKYIKADDLKGRDVPVTISHTAIEKLGNDAKLILYFRGKEKGMVCNKTNAGRIAYLYGEDTDDWAGQAVVLCAEFVEFQGKTVKGLRVKPPANGKPAQAAPAAAKPNRAAEAMRDAPPPRSPQFEKVAKEGYDQLETRSTDDPDDVIPF